MFPNYLYLPHSKHVAYLTLLCTLCRTSLSKKYIFNIFITLFTDDIFYMLIS
jgi:hypothetical protein